MMPRPDSSGQMAPEPRAASDATMVPVASHFQRASEATADSLCDNNKLASMLIECAIHVKNGESDHPILKQTFCKFQSFIQGASSINTLQQKRQPAINVSENLGKLRCQTESFKSTISESKIQVPGVECSALAKTTIWDQPASSSSQSSEKAKEAARPLRNENLKQLEHIEEGVDAKCRLADDEAAKQSATEAAADKRSAAEVELAKRRVLEERRQAAEEELAKRQLAEKETEKRHRLAEDEARKHKEGEEEIRRRNADRVKSQQDAERRRREEEERRVLEKERMQRDEEELRRKAAERQAADQRKQQEEAVRKQQEAWAQQQQSWQRQQAEEEQRRRAAEQQAAEARRRQEEAYRRQQQWQQQQQRPPGSQQYQQQHGIPQHHPPPPPSNQQYYHRSTPPPTSQPSHPQTSGRPGQPGSQAQQQTKSPVNMKYAKMANQTGDSSQMAITNIKHGVLVEWALQPPTLQVLRPIDILLTTIHTVFPPKFGCPGHGYFAKWTSIKLEDVRKGSQPDDDKLTKGIRKLRFFLHPDKLPRDLTAEQAFMCKMLWDITSDAFEEHKKWSEKLV
jgi:chemotaxis protein histidine kinase CheA